MNNIINNNINDTIKKGKITLELLDKQGEQLNNIDNKNTNINQNIEYSNNLIKKITYATYNISKNIYNELALSKEKTAIDVKKNTPIFTIIKPVVIPNKKSDPKRSLIVFIFSFMGLIITSVYTLLKSNLIKIWKEINKKNNHSKKN